MAGFSFVTRGSPASDDPETLDVAEFFVLRGWRRSGVGRRAAPLLWDRLPGPWTVRVSTGTGPACRSGNRSCATTRVAHSRRASGPDRRIRGASSRSAARSARAQRVKYARVERERRFLLARPPAPLGADYREIEDLYFPETTLRLRAVRAPDGSPLQWKLGQKQLGPGGPAEQITTSLYLSEPEYTLLERLPGRRLRKRRYDHAHAGRAFAIDVFLGALDGLVLAEVNADTDAELGGFRSRRSRTARSRRRRSSRAGRWRPPIPGRCCAARTRCSAAYLKARPRPHGTIPRMLQDADPPAPGA